jgi:hypothetical protein
MPARILGITIFNPSMILSSLSNREAFVASAFYWHRVLLERITDEAATVTWINDAQELDEI